MNGFSGMKTIFGTLLLSGVATLFSAASLGQEEAAAADDAPLTANELAAPVGVSDAADAAPAEPPQGEQPLGVRRPVVGATRDAELWFTFSKSKWETVLTWLSGTAELSLEYDNFPPGTFTYSDPSRSYTVTEALDVINLGLMKRGFVIVRRGRSLQLIDLEAPLVEKMISEIAEVVSPEELDRRGAHDIVSCVLPLGSMTPDAARDELELMKGPWGQVRVLDSARQVRVTETAGKLRAIRDVLESTASADSSVIELELEHRGAEDLLQLARPLLGLEPGENVNDEIRISVSLYGDLIMATGDAAKLKLLETIVTKRDKPLPEIASTDGTEVALPVFQTHFLRNADTASAFDVLQTMLADIPDTRVGLDPKTKAVLVRARPETQEFVANIISRLEGEGQQFEVIPLRQLKPSEAMLTVNQFFQKDDEDGGDGPIVGGDELTGRFWVRGSAQEIADVKKLMSELEGGDALSGMDDRIRILPYSGRSAQDAVEQVREIWRVTGRRNEIRTRTPSRGEQGIGLPERRIPRQPIETDDAEEEAASLEAAPANATEVRATDRSDYHFVTDRDEEGTVEATAAGPSSTVTSRTSEPNASDIIVQHSPAGMVIASEDTEALNAFESLLNSVATPSMTSSDLPTIFWLKFAKADVTAELVANVLGGSESTLTSAVDSATGGGLTGMINMFGGGGGGGSQQSSSKSFLTATGSVTMVPEMRLNALIVQASEIDLQMIEMILEKVDRVESPENIETTPQPQLIPVIYQDAAEVADVVKSIFASRMQSSEQGGGGGGGGRGGGQPSPQDFLNAIRGGGRGGRQQTPVSEPTKISIAVATTSNSIVVIASPQDFLEIRALVDALDYPENQEVVRAIPVPGGLSSEALVQALESLLGTQVTTSTGDGSSNNSGGSTASGGNSAPSAADIQRRAEIFNRLRAGGAFGGGGPGGGRGGGPGGGRGGLFGGGRGGGPGGGGGAGGRGR